MSSDFVDTFAPSPYAFGNALLGEYRLASSDVVFTFWTSPGKNFEHDVYVDFASGFFSAHVSTPEEAVFWASSELGITGKSVVYTDITTTFYEEYVRYAFDQISNYANLTFTEAAPGEQPTSIIFGALWNGDDFGFSTRPTENATGSTVTALMVSPNNIEPIGSNDGGSEAHGVAIHELLHSVGIEHPNSLPSALNYNMYTVMSYNYIVRTNPFGNKVEGFVGGNPLTPMALDIHALQQLYGVVANATTDTSYSWIADGSKFDTDANDGHVGVGGGFYCIWDTGGLDTIDFSAADQRSLINLNEATIDVGTTRASLLLNLYETAAWGSLPDFVKEEFSNTYAGAGGYLSTTFSTAFRPGGFTIANNPTGSGLIGIERAIGSAHDDVIIGNAKDNLLLGNAGDDLLFGFDGNDTLRGGEGADELRGGEGADRIYGGSGNDIIHYGLDGDTVDGGADNDTFVYDGLVQGGGTAMIHGGRGYDTLYLDMTGFDHGVFSDFIMESRFGGVTWEDVEHINVGWTKNVDGTWSQGSGFSFEVSTMFSEAFRGSNAALTQFLGSVQNSTFTAISKASVIVAGNGSAGVFQGALSGIKGDVTATRGYFDWNGQDIALDVSYVNGVLRASLPTGFDFGLDDLGLGHASIHARFEIDHEWVDSYGSGDNYYEVVSSEVFNTWANIGVFNGYDHGLTALSGPDVVLATNHGWDAEVRITSDSQETLRPVRYSLAEDHGGQFVIDDETGVVSTDGRLLFPNGQDITITVRADDGYNVVEKDITFVMDRDIETPPIIYGGEVSEEIIGRKGEHVVQQLPLDDNEDGNLVPLDPSHYELVVDGATGSSPLLEIKGSLWSVVLARNPELGEIGVTLHATLTVKDSTGQTAQSTFDFMIDPLEKIVAGTSGDDYLETDWGASRPWIINAGEGNDEIYGHAANSTLNGGAGDDSIYLYADHGKGNGGSGDDYIVTSGSGSILNGGLGTDTLVFYGDNSTVKYGSIAESALDNAVLNEGAPPAMDVLRFFGDTDTIDLSALGEIEWAGQASSSTSMLAEFFQDGDSGFFLIDADRDADYDFGIEFQNIAATSQINFNGLDGWMLS